LFNAALEECKGILTVIESWKLMKNKDKAELHIIGDSPLAEYQMYFYIHQNAILLL